MTRREAVKEFAFGAGVIAILVSMTYTGVAWSVFRWRNPTANDMSFYRDWWSVVTWKRIEGYQIGGR